MKAATFYQIELAGKKSKKEAEKDRQEHETTTLHNHVTQKPLEMFLS